MIMNPQPVPRGTLGPLLHSVIDMTQACLPPDVRRVIKGARVGLAHLGHNNHGEKIEGAARDDGHVIFLDVSIMERERSNPRYLEDLLAHEAAHAYRARRGLRTKDDAHEEAEVARLTKSWGFHPCRRRRR